MHVNELYLESAWVITRIPLIVLLVVNNISEEAGFDLNSPIKQSPNTIRIFNITNDKTTAIQYSMLGEKY